MENNTIFKGMNNSKTARDIDSLADVLAMAFVHDPLFQYFFPDEKTRHRLSLYTFRFIVAHASKKGVVCETSSALEGASVWLPSESINRSLIDQLRFGAVNMLIKQGRDTINRQIEASDHMKAIHSKLLTEPHLYLSTIGITEDHRGKGLASKLIRPMLEKADQNMLSCYLDTHNENNIGLYQQYGFKVVQESVIPGSTVKHWAMVRESE